MAAVGGPVESISINNRSFAVTSDADGNRKLGGFENEMQPNGDGTARTVKTRVPWSFGGLSIEIDDSRDDQEFLQDIADGNEEVPMAFVMVSGEIYQGVGQIVGEIAMSTSSVSAPLEFSGPGKLTAQ